MTEAEAKTSKYEVTIIVNLPGYVKPTVVKIAVEAYGNTDAIIKATNIWNKAVLPEDVHVKKMEVITA